MASFSVRAFCLLVITAAVSTLASKAPIGAKETALEREFRYQHHQDLGDCGVNSFTFFGKCFCEPGWEGQKSLVEVPHAWPPHLTQHREAQSIPKRGLYINCTVPLMEIGDCPCEPESLDRAFLHDPNWIHPKGFRCQNLCRLNSEVGVIYGDLARWHVDEAENGRLTSRDCEDVF